MKNQLFFENSKQTGILCKKENIRIQQLGFRNWHYPNYREPDNFFSDMWYSSWTQYASLFITGNDSSFKKYKNFLFHLNRDIIISKYISTKPQSWKYNVCVPINLFHAYDG